MNETRKIKWQATVLFKSLQIINRKDRKKLLFITFFQSILAILDLLGVAAIGLVGAIAVKGIQSLEPGGRISSALEVIGLDKSSIQNQVIILVALASTLFIVRTVLSIHLTRKTLLFMSLRASEITEKLTVKLFAQNLLKLQQRSNQETLYALTSGVSFITLGVIAAAVSIVADTALLVLIIGGLFFIDVSVAISTILFFALLGLVVYKSLSSRARELGISDAIFSLEVNEKVLEVLTSYREILVKNRRTYYANEISKTRLKLTNVRAEFMFMPSVSKYIIEAGIVLGAVAISASQFLLQDAVGAISTLAVFMAATSRLAPAILRIQSTAIQVRIASGSAIPTLELINELNNFKYLELPTGNLDINHENFEPIVKLVNIDFKYPGKSTKALDKINLEIEVGEIVAIVGPSGSGKTTLADVILGAIQADAGLVQISDLEPLKAVVKWPGAIAYVPQDVAVFNRTIKENVGLGFPPEDLDDYLVNRALELAHLDKFVSSLPEGLETKAGDRGTKLSGGQRQRLGIARALFTKPKLIVLDEATSSLDGQSESDIADSINDMRGEITVILIAHRLSTVKNADKVVYLEDGKIVSIGTFEDVRRDVPNFEKQVLLMGL
jgi:ABC-type multidrug transport system fused ATPase/permease subunit